MEISYDGKHLTAWAKTFYYSNRVGSFVIVLWNLLLSKNPVNFEIICFQFDYFGVKEEDIFVLVVSREKMFC